MLGWLGSRNVKWPQGPVTCVHPPVHSPAHASCLTALPLPLLLWPPRRYFIKLVISAGDLSYLQNTNKTTPVAPTPSQVLHQACEAEVQEGRVHRLPRPAGTQFICCFPVRTPRLLLHGTGCLGCTAPPPCRHAIRSQGMLLHSVLRRQRQQLVLESGLCCAPCC